MKQIEFEATIPIISKLGKDMEAILVMLYGNFQITKLFI